ncbi:MAG: hypothetical protein ACOYXB_10950 [Bacteroidota bacterium]
MQLLETGVFNKWPSFSEREKLQFRKKLLMFSFFLLLSVIIWFLNALSKNYTTEIKYPVSYSKFPQGKVLIDEPPDHLVLRVNAHGYALMRYKLVNRPVPVNFKVSAFTMNSLAADPTRFYILTRFAREQVSRQLPQEFELIDILPDTLVFHFARNIRKELPVKAVLNFTVDRQFTTVSGTVLTPDSIWVTGPDVMLDTMTAIRTQRVDLGTLTKSFEGKLALESIKYINAERDNVNCNIELERYTEVVVDVPLEVVHLPDSMSVQTFPPKIRISSTVGLSKFALVTPSSFRAQADYREVAEGKTRLTVRIVREPEFLMSSDFNPKSVEYLLSEK